MKVLVVYLLSLSVIALAAVCAVEIYSRLAP